LSILINLGLFILLLITLFRLSRSGLSLAKQVLLGLLLGSVFAAMLVFVYGASSSQVAGTLEWTNVVAVTYVNLLRVIIMPLVLITMIAAVLKVERITTLGGLGGSIILVLLATTMIAALVGVGFALLFGLDASSLVAGSDELMRADALESRRQSMANMSMAQLITSFIPSNIFSDLAGTRATSVIGVVIFGLLFGLAALLVSAEDSEKGKQIRQAVDTIQSIIMKLVQLVMALTPYGVAALMVRVITTADGGAIINLISFVVASYLAIIFMFGVHLLIIAIMGNDVIGYLKKIWPVLTFAFVTRSSAATIPLSIKTQIEDLQIPVPIANMSASFGATIGQNGCAGIYPAMLAVMVAPTVGVDINFSFLLALTVIVALSSFGVAGVGGGATNAALVVLPAMGLPITVVALLISIEPLIDMARTALNVNGSVTSALVTKGLASPKPIAGNLAVEIAER